ncbi:hypothetical protein HMPREF9554_01834 [Treponema phagedenis F0421]|nr:hypothetical protein HMPREF9554_01834 [Treponema phagedenis F0421]
MNKLNISVLIVLPFIIMVLISYLYMGFLGRLLNKKNSLRLILRLISAVLTFSFIFLHYSYLYLVEGVIN